MKEFWNDLYEAMGGNHLTSWLLNVVVWAIIILALPIATWLSTQDYEAAKTSLNVVWGIFMSPFLIYFVNFYVFGPLLFFMNEKEARSFRVYNKLSNRTRYWIFGLCNLITIPLFNSRFFLLWWHRDSIPNMPEMTPNMWIGFFSGAFMFFMLNCIVAAIAIGIRHFIRNRDIKQQLKDEKAKNTEAELAWLLLRYAMYETNKKTVPISGEVEFMRNYIALMKLRCNEKTEVKTTFEVEQDVEIAPLLFISLIENAFKHGVSSSRHSMIDIHLEQKNNSIVFTCDNTNYPKDDADRSGSGIGLENTRRRLDLMYAGRYTWQKWLENDIYHVYIKLSV